jgi:hypothetical protein
MRSATRILVHHHEVASKDAASDTDSDVNGSKHSLLPRICEVDAVGIGATKQRIPDSEIETFGHADPSPIQRRAWRYIPQIKLKLAF